MKAVALITGLLLSSQVFAELMPLGPFLPQPALTLYIVGDGEPMTAKLAVYRSTRPEGDRLTVRVFDADEKLTFWQYVEIGRTPLPFDPGSTEVWGIPLPPPVKPQPNELLYAADLSLSGDGVQQVRIGAGARNSAVTLHLARQVQWGVSFQNGFFAPWSGQAATQYLYVPPHAEQLQFRGGPIAVFDETGKQLAATTDKRAATVTIPVERTDVVWRVVFADVQNWRASFAGFPVILCPTAQAARTIRASVEVLDDGTVVSHKFQRRIAELLPKLLVPENVGDSDALLSLIVPLKQHEAAWLANPRRNYHLLNAYGMMPSVIESLRTQNLDPASHFSGALGDWRKFVDKPSPENRWDRLRSVPGMRAGVTHTGAAAESLARAYYVNESFNPLYGRKEVLYRAAAAALRDLMTLGEDETFRGVGADLNPYTGFMAFVTAQKVFPVYALVAPHMPDDIREVWTEGLRRIVDRTYTDGLTSARNQSSHYLVAYEAFAQGSGDQRYHQLARRWAQRFVEGAHPAGFNMENTGPDASYTGMTHWHMAVYAAMSHDPVMIKAIAKSYRFFNHTVAPEPDGHMLGGYNFNHRVASSFVDEQWGGAKGILDDVLPEVGLWHRTLQVAATLKKQLANDQPPTRSLSNISTARYLYFAKANTKGVWPAQERRPFIRNFADQMIAVKRPGYYTSIYVGKPAPVDFYIRGRKLFQKPLPDDVENTGGTLDMHKVTPFLGGGVTLLWTPAYGTSLVGMPQSPLTHHGLVAVRADQSRTWEDYFATEFALDKKAGVLTVTGRIEEQPIRYERRYRFADDALHVALTLTADEDVSLAALFENLPLAMGAAKTQGAAVRIAGETDGRAKADLIQVRDKQGAGVDIRFDRAVDMVVQRNGLRNRSLQVGRVQVSLPRSLKAGQTVTLSYRIEPVARDD